MTDHHDLLLQLLDDPKAARIALVLLHHRQDELAGSIKSIEHRMDALMRENGHKDSTLRDQQVTILTEQQRLKDNQQRIMETLKLIEQRMYDDQGKGDWASSLVDWGLKWWYLVLPAIMALTFALAKTGLLEKLIRLFL